jgi:uncharacterized protein (TIGR02145 family)
MTKLISRAVILAAAVALAFIVCGDSGVGDGKSEEVDIYLSRLGGKLGGNGPCAGLTVALPGSECCISVPSFDGCDPCADLTVAFPGSECCMSVPSFNGCDPCESDPGSTACCGANRDHPSCETRPPDENLLDTRDNKEYNTIITVGKRWMARNLDYDTADGGGSWCYGDDPVNCDKYGRLYDWNTAMIVCPSGWRLPTRLEWEELVRVAGGATVAGRNLKSQDGWVGSNGNETNLTGFSALPGGHRNSRGEFIAIGGGGSWWSSTPHGDDDAYSLTMAASFDNTSGGIGSKNVGYSVRCVENGDYN